MNDEQRNDTSRLEREVASAFSEMAPTRAPDHLLQSVMNNASRRRKHARWLALIKEPPMRISETVAVGSPTARIAAIVVATLLLAVMVAGAGIAGSRLLAADAIIVVDQSGNGTVETIGAAVAKAVDGDEILILPGTYAESVTIDKDITLHGKGRDTVVIEFGHEGSPQYTFFAGTSDAEDGVFGILIQGSDAEISHLTLRGPDVEGQTASVVADGGAPFVHDITVEGNQALYVVGGSTATVSDIDLSDAWVFLVDSPATFEGSQAIGITANTDTDAEGLGAAIIRGNHAYGITLERPAVVEGNTLTAPDEPIWSDKAYGSGIDVTYGSGNDVSSAESWIVRDNIINGFVDDVAINVANASAGEIVGNTVNDARIGLSLGSAGHVVGENAITAVETGIIIGSNATPSLSGNTIEGATDTGLRVGVGSQPTLSGNTICSNAQNLQLADGAVPVIDDTNEICEDFVVAG